MINKTLLMAIILIGIISNIFPQTKFRRAVYLTQSVGTHIYDHSQVGSPGTTTVPNEIAIYNSTHGYTGNNVFTLYNPTDDYPPGGNQMWKWQKAFYDSAGYSFKEDYLDTDTYNVIMVKFCAANQSGIWFWWYEGPQDTLNYPLTQSTYNYQWYIRKIVRKMEEYPNKFFFLWNIPSATEQEGTPADMQRLADFNLWMTDTLQAGLDSYGAFPPNIKIFDFFNLLKHPSSNYMNVIFRDAFNDYHPNALASDVVSPILVQRMFDAAIAYENIAGSTNFSIDSIRSKWLEYGIHPRIKHTRSECNDVVAREIAVIKRIQIQRHLSTSNDSNTRRRLLDEKQWNTSIQHRRRMAGRWNTDSTSQFNTGNGWLEYDWRI